MGLDRPSPDHANARVHPADQRHLETGHYFNPHAQRIIEGKMAGAKLIVIDTRLSNTASMADYWLPPWPGIESRDPAGDRQRSHLDEGRYDREFVRRWVNWEEYLRQRTRTRRVDLRELRDAAEERLRAATPSQFAAEESGRRRPR